MTADLSKPISYNGVTVENSLTLNPNTPGKGTLIEAIDFSTVPATYYLDKKASQDGMDAADIFLGGRQITIDAAIYGSSAGNLADRANNFMISFSPVIAYNNNSGALGFSPLKFFRATDITSTWDTATYPNGIPLEIEARPIAPPTFRIVRDEQNGKAARGSVLKCRVVLVARDPRIYLQTAASVAITTASATAVNRGNYSTFPIITFTMTAAGSSAATFAVDGYSVKLNLSSTSSGTYSIRYTSRSIVDSNEAFRSDLFDTTFTQRFPQISADDSVVIGFNLTGMSTRTINYTEAFP